MFCKSRVVRLFGHECVDGAFSIIIENIGLYPETMKKCAIITERFTRGTEFFFGFFRTDGLNISSEEFVRYDEEIPRFLRANGRYQEIIHIIQKRNKVKTISSYHAAASLPVNTATYDMLPKFFHYHLETAYFCPKIDWETFVESYRDYIDHGCGGYVMNGFTDFLFAYGDSGDFSMTFNPNLYHKNIVYDEIAKIVFG